jgi:hypothetical protein
MKSKSSEPANRSDPLESLLLSFRLMAGVVAELNDNVARMADLVQSLEQRIVALEGHVPMSGTRLH